MTISERGGIFIWLYYRAWSPPMRDQDSQACCQIIDAVQCVCATHPRTFLRR